MTGQYDFAPIGAVGASDAGAARTAVALSTPQLAGRALPVTIPARIYICGITPYDVTHLGHAATFVWADALARVLRLIEVPAEVARNVTDVDDVLTAAAARDGADYASFGLLQEHQFDRDMKALAVRAPQHLPRARHHIDHVIRLATTLLELGAAYERDGHVYFRGATVPDDVGLDRGTAHRLLADYGDTPDDPHRDDPFDVPIWRPSDTSHPAWPSPWGPGRPGWHAECTAMALASLGGLVDVLVGGQDLAFPHHAYQAAMARAAVGGQFTRAEMHVGAVRYRGSKMAKSTGNLVLVDDLLHTVPGPVIRLLLLNRRWSQPWDFDRADLDTATATLDGLYKAAGSTTDDATGVDAVRAALLDDLDVPAAVAVAHDAGGDAARLLIRSLALD